MEGIVNIFGFCVYFGVMILCAILIIYTILRWIGDSKTRNRRLFILSGIAFVILLLMLSRYYIKYLEGPDGDKNKKEIVETEQLSKTQDDSGAFEFSMVTDGCLTITKTVIGSLIFVVVFASAVTLLFIVILCIYNGLRTIIQGKPGTKEPETKEPETKEPETKEPETEEPKTKEPETEEPETEEPETEEPETEEPETEEPETEEPETEEPKTEKSKTEKSKTEKSKTEKPKNDQFHNALKQPEVILVVTLGILSFFFILPMLVGEQGRGELIETWRDGIIKINNVFDINIAGADTDVTDTTDQEGTDVTDTTDQEGIDVTDTIDQVDTDRTDTTDQVDTNRADIKDQDDNIFVTYILVYIIVMGVGFAVIKLLYVVFEHVLKEERIDLIDKYSSPIALLSVGVAILLSLKRGEIPAKTRFQTILELLKAFGTVIFIIAIVILTLEIVRLLMDIEQKLIRQEAKYLFISLVGQSALLVLKTLNFIYSGVCGMISNEEDTELDEVEQDLKKMIVGKMKREIDYDDDDHDGNFKTSFSEFDEKVTKK